MPVTWLLGKIKSLFRKILKPKPAFHAKDDFWENIKPGSLVEYSCENFWNKRFDIDDYFELNGNNYKVVSIITNDYSIFNYHYYQVEFYVDGLKLISHLPIKSTDLVAKPTKLETLNKEIEEWLK
jgi:hypothetical protein